ncbi:MAG: agmatine deiminase family protein [Clostridia bacterium]|nr:agmatine deiminase family protein [Clostridia bacterium]
MAFAIRNYWFKIREKVYFSSILLIDDYDKRRYNYPPIIKGIRAGGYFEVFISGTKDIWLRDFMPVKTKDGRYVSFRYEPSYLKSSPDLRTDYKRDMEENVREKLGIEVEYSDINLDGGNVVMSPSKRTAIISDRVFSENPEREKEELLTELERLLAAKVIIIPSLKSDMTGHADGMVRFVDETTVIGNRTPYKNGHEQKIKKLLKKHGIDVIDFPYFSFRGISAVGTYLNFLETDETIFLPIFGCEMDDEAISAAKSIFAKKIVPVRCEDIAKEGGCLNCISWEM